MRTATVIEFNDHYIKLVQARKNRQQYTIVHCAVSSVTNCSENDFLVIFKGMAAKLPQARDRPILLLPRRHALLRQMRLPSHDPAELEDMIGIQLARQIPYSPEEVIFRYHVLSRGDDGYCLVLVIILCKEIIRRHEGILQRAGIKNAVVTLSSLGLLGWTIGQASAGKTGNDQVTAVLHINARDSEICFCYKGKLLFSRSLLFQRESSGPADTDELIKEIQVSLALYQNEGLGPPVKEIWIFPGSFKKENLTKAIKSQFGISAKIMDSLTNISCGDDTSKAIADGSIASGLGVLLSDPKDLISLGAKPAAREAAFAIGAPRIVQLVSLLLVLMALGVSGPLLEIRKDQKYCALLKNQSEQLHAESARAKERMRLVESLDDELAQDVFIPDLFEALSQLTPEEISFRKITLDHDRNLTVQGYAPTQASVDEFQRRLRASSRFHEVQLRFAVNRQMARAPVMDFKIDMRLYEEERKTP